MSEFYNQAALRHFDDAEALAKNGQYDGAGHLIGFATECAVKHAIKALRPTSEAPFLHLPDLIEKAKRLLSGRKTHPMFTLLEKPNYMSGWKIDHRYGCDGTVSKELYTQWRTDASRSLGAAQIRRQSSDK